MDPIAHTLAGTLLGRAHPSNKRGLVLACVLGALAPDIDIIYALGGRDLYMTEHRGFTHSLLGFIPVSLLAAWVAWLFVRRRQDSASFKLIFGMAALGVLSHLYLDWCTSWGTMLFWPDRTRFAMDTMFIVDVWYISLLAVPILLSVFVKRHRALICTAGILGAALYHLLTAFNHYRAIDVAVQDRPDAQWRAAFPQPLSPFRWEAFNRREFILRGGRIDFLRSRGALDWREWKIPELTPETKAVFESPKGKNFLWFSRVPMWSQEPQADGSCMVTCWDLRFYAYFWKDRVIGHFGQRFLVKDGKVSGGGF